MQTLRTIYLSYSYGLYNALGTKTGRPVGPIFLDNVACSTKPKVYYFMPMVEQPQPPFHSSPLRTVGD